MCACVSTPCLAPTRSLGSRRRPHCSPTVRLYACAHACIVPTPGICLLSQPHRPEPHVTRLVLSAGERCHPEAGQGMFSLFSLLPEEEKWWPFPRGQLVAVWQPGLTRAGLCMTPKWGEEGCCHGGLCEANSSRVKWEIFIPRVRQRAGQRPRAGEPGCYGHSEAVVCGQVALGRFLAVSSLAVSVSPPGWGEASALPCQGRCGEPGAYSGGGPGLREILVDCVCLTPSLLLDDPLCVGCFGDTVS